jgi:hypothetical protein
MDASRFAGSGFLSLADVKDGRFRGEIAAVEEGGYKKLVLTFTNGLRFSLNATNTTEMIKAFGSETDDWIGERVELYEGEASYQGKTVPSVRLTPRSCAKRMRRRRSRSRSQRARTSTATWTMKSHSRWLSSSSAPSPGSLPAAAL